MAQERFTAISRISAASVVDFPEPVGPAMRIIPERRALSETRLSGSPTDFASGTIPGSRRMHRQLVPRDL